MKRPISMTQSPDATSYEDWMRSEGIPIVGPAIRRDFEAALQAEGIARQCPSL